MIKGVAIVYFLVCGQPNLFSYWLMVCGYKMSANRRAVSLSALASFQYTTTRNYTIARALLVRKVKHAVLGVRKINVLLQPWCFNSKYPVTSVYDKQFLCVAVSMLTLDKLINSLLMLCCVIQSRKYRVSHICSYIFTEFQIVSLSSSSNLRLTRFRQCKLVTC